MDKITRAISDWLLTYEKIKEFTEIIHIEELTDKVDTLALQRTGVERLADRYIGEKDIRKEYGYILMLKLDSESDEQRENALDWLDELGEWIEAKNIARDLPKTENKKCYKALCSNELSYETDSETKVTIYYIQLAFDFKGGK